MALPKGAEQSNIKLLKALSSQSITQQEVLYQWEHATNKHQLAICFDFLPEFTLDLNKGTAQGNNYGERVMRLCESVNQPDTIKADIFTRTPNNGTLSGVRPGVKVLGAPLSPEKFLAKVGFILVSFVRPGSKMTEDSE